MIRNPEQTIGKMVDNVRYGIGSFIDEQGYPETQVMPQPFRREGIREFWFEIDPAAGCFGADFAARPASLYFMDQRFYRGVCLKGFFQREASSDINQLESLQESQETEDTVKLILKFTAKSGRYYSHFQSSDFTVD
ncbi:hypothetical protein [Holdemania massiliensis]|uniref:hypothetical protein n=1 Tax=Holdemania massiliensis TaxID=1468449 RepID=UPI001F05F516|nr:hypothetical protein [Holdemania massiliensis]MCH1942398.1 hypothetical protein [Holdemania massiliensis]